jgi:hypothetical protein
VLVRAQPAIRPGDTQEDQPMLEQDGTDHQVTTTPRPDEYVHADVDTEDGRLLVTDRRVEISRGARIALDLRFDELRRIQLDIERHRPATMVVVPDNARYEPQVLPIPAEALDTVTAALSFIGRTIQRAGVEDRQARADG